MGIFSMGVLLGYLEGGSSTKDYERCMKGALEMENFSLKRLSAEGSFIGDPERYVKKGSRYGHLSPVGPHWGTWRGFTCQNF
jgi:hypothetical protein